MRVLNANIDIITFDYFKNNLKDFSCIQETNKLLKSKFGIVDFFSITDELNELKDDILINENLLSEPDRAEYGDFQTNSELAYNVVQTIKTKGNNPKLILEPTCGKGNFIIASLLNFENVESIIGIEIYKPYLWETKFKIISYYLNHKRKNKPEIYLFHDSFFDFNFKEISNDYKNTEILVVGNPPWVTNSELGALNSENLPKKRNFKKHSGIDAITGKGNFDIAEYITIQLIETFQNFSGSLGFLIKKSVIKNIVNNQKLQEFKIGNLQQYTIDAKREFNVSVEAAFFYCSFDNKPEFDCKDYDFYNPNESKSSFGWVGNNFVSNIQAYKKTESFDGLSPFEWRQGVKHDCSSVMELDKINGQYSNKKGITNIELEDDLVYGLLKSSDLKTEVVDKVRKHTIITQRKVGQETKYIQYDYPNTFDYLMTNIDYFNRRKSSIYKNKPLFSIFGIGDYSFKPYKVAISGLYKNYLFSLVLPKNDKPLMLDDTCYLIGFDKLESAVFTLIILNSSYSIEFLKSITFLDDKRVFTKDVLMRIDLLAIAKEIRESYLYSELNRINSKLEEEISINDWTNYLEHLQPESTGQLELF